MKEWPANGFKVVTNERYGRPDTSVTGQVLKVIASTPDAVVVGGSVRVHATNPESTLGTGQKTAGPTEPARRRSANHAALTDGEP